MHTYTYSNNNSNNNNNNNNNFAGYFSPIQLGVGTPGGSEAAVHVTRRFIEAMPDGHVVAKLDFCNAFNSLRKDQMLRSVLSAVPGIYRFCHLCYSNPSIRKFDDRTILSHEGPHQGDPLGSLLFSVFIHPDLLSLQYELVAGFIDDLTLGSPSDVVAADLDYMMVQGYESTLPCLK